MSNILRAGMVFENPDTWRQLVIIKVEEELVWYIDSSSNNPETPIPCKIQEFIDFWDNTNLIFVATRRLISH